MPELWALVFAKTVYDYGSGPYPKHTHLTDFWLPRSGTFPLEINANLDEDSEESSRMIDALRPYSHRTKKLCVTFPLGIELLRYPLPILNELMLVSSAEEPPEDLLLAAPGLTTVTFSGFIHPLTHFTRIPWSQLTEIRFSGCIEDITSFCVLAECCNLQTLEIELWPLWDFGWHNFPKIIHLSKLTSLILKDEVRILSLDAADSSFFYNLVTPNLRKLTVESNDVPTSAILSLVSRSLCLLQHIEINYGLGIIPKAELVKRSRDSAQKQLTLVESIPSLRKLDVFKGEDRYTSTMADSRLAERAASLATEGTT